MKSKRQLRDIDRKGVFLNDDLTPFRAKLTRVLRNDPTIGNVWTIEDTFRCNLSLEELDYYSRVEDEWFCMKCISNMFPFSQTSDDELNYLALPLGTDDNLADLYDNCTSLNFRFTDNTEYFLSDKADPDDNLYKHLSMKSLFYTEEQFKHKFAVSTE